MAGSYVDAVSLECNVFRGKFEQLNSYQLLSKILYLHGSVAEDSFLL